MNGRKTYIVMAVLIALALAGNWISVPDWLFWTLAGVGGITLRHGIKTESNKPLTYQRQ